MIETSRGSDGQVVKCLAPLTTSVRQLREGLSILSDCVRASLENADDLEMAEVSQ